MIQAVSLVVAIAALLALSYATLGYQPTYQIAYGALTLMAAMISLTFLWLWARRATPLALGMSLSWAGASSVMGWWWVHGREQCVVPVSVALFRGRVSAFRGHSAVVWSRVEVRSGADPCGCGGVGALASDDLRSKTRDQAS